MSILRLFATLLMTLGLHAWAGDAAILPSASDLRQDAIQARQEKKPIVILFSLPDCSYCHVVRQHYLAPLLREGDPNSRPIIREVDISSKAALTGFRGEPSSQRAFAAQLHVRFAPTVLFLDATGNPLTEPLVGGDSAGMYGAHLDRAFEEASRKLSGRRPG